MSEQLSIVPTNAVKELVDTLDALGIDALHLHVDGRKMTDRRPDMSLWITYRADFERLCAHLKLKPVERIAHGHGQRQWYAEHDDDRRRLLVQCVSFEHHDDWEPREPS